MCVVSWYDVLTVPPGVSALRHIRLLNTQEQKPITNSRDTQELMWDAGCEVLAIFSKFREKTSLLQDWGFHEVSPVPFPFPFSWSTRLM